MKRCLIYFFYDNDGIVDRYIIETLKDLRKLNEKLVFVVNGKITKEGRENVEKIATDLIVRENIGFDAWAYKEAIEYIGWEELYKFDELIMMNFTMYGPIVSYKEMFEEMESRDIDFWGISKYNANKMTGNGYAVPTHIISFFIAVKSDVIKSYSFKQHWNTLHEINTIAQSTEFHESVFTKKMSDVGFTWAVYNDCVESNQNNYPLVWNAKEFLEDKCPVIKRKNFFYPPYYGFLYNSMGESTVEAIDYIKKNTDYDMSLITDNVLRTSTMYDIKNAMQLNYILPSTVSMSTSTNESNSGIYIYIYTAIIHISSKNCFEKYSHYLDNFAENVEFNFVFENENVSEDLRGKILSMYPQRKLSFYYCDGEESTLTIRQLLSQAAEKFELALVLNFNRRGVSNRESATDSAVYKCMECLCRTPELIENILKTFAENEKLGMLMPPPPNHDEYSLNIGEDSAKFNAQAQKIADLLKCPFDNTQNLISPYFGMYWVRTKALGKYLNCNEDLERMLKQFSNEKTYQYDCLNALLGLFVQSQLYYPAWVLSNELAAIELTNLNYYLDQVKKAVSPKLSNHTFDDVCKNIKTLVK